MTDPQYVRVNVTTATSEPTYDEYGNRIAEVDMMLPSNLVNNADRIKSAKMAVMKLQTPLSCLPGPVLDEIEVNSGTSPYGLYRQSRIGLWPKRPNSYGAFVATDAATRVLHGVNEVSGVTLQITQSHYDKLLPIGYYPNYHLASIDTLLQDISSNLTNRLNMDFSSSPNGRSPIFQFVVNSDDTISLRVTMIHPLYQIYPFTSRTLSDPQVRETQTVISRSFVHGYEDGQRNLAYEVSIVVSPNVAKLLPTLPWIRCIKQSNNEISNLFAQVGEAFYVLNTSVAHFSIESNVNTFTREVTSGGQTTAYTYTTDTLVYHFDSSDAVALTGVSSIVLTMNGAAFNQQVYPINMSAETMAAAQTTTVPILEVYYPLWVKPSDLTTNLVVVKDTFSDAAPVNIHPSLLKERHIKFKLYYITTNGELKEMKIPPIMPFSFQICFELTMVH